MSTEELEAKKLREQVIGAVAECALQEASDWFSNNDREGEKFYPNYQLREMAQGELLERKSLHNPAGFVATDNVKAGYKVLDELIRDALAYRRMTKS